MFKNAGVVYNSTPRQSSMLCAYQNKTDSLQIIKIENVNNFYWEKVVLPWQTVLFNTVKQAELTIYSNDNATAILTDTISCSRLQVAKSLSI